MKLQLKRSMPRPTQLGKYEHEPDNVITIGSSAVGGLYEHDAYAILSDGDGSFADLRR